VLKKVIFLILFVLLFSAAGTFVYMGQRKTVADSLCYSGTIEAVRSRLAFQVSGTVGTVYADEGDRVKNGTLLAKLDDSPFLVKQEEARALLDQAMKNIERMEILLSVYETTLPLDVKRAQAGVKSAEALLKEALNDKKRFDGLKAGNTVSQRDWERADLKNETAQAQLAEAQAVLAQSQSNLKKVELTRREIDVARAQRDAARAVLRYAEVQLGYAALKAPFDGILTTRSMEPGEVVTPGREVMTLSDLSMAEMKIYIGEEDIGKVKPGEKADVKVDSYPDRTYTAKVSFISPEAEFTPKIIQTHKERVKLVYLVKLLIPNPDLTLKPGMPADACFETTTP
jgi:HlyD family secretion protein